MEINITRITSCLDTSLFRRQDENRTTLYCYIRRDRERPPAPSPCACALTPRQKQPHVVVVIVVCRRFVRVPAILWNNNNNNIIGCWRHQRGCMLRERDSLLLLLLLSSLSSSSLRCTLLLLHTSRSRRRRRFPTRQTRRLISRTHCEMSVSCYRYISFVATVIASLIHYDPDASPPARYALRDSDTEDGVS